MPNNLITAEQSKRITSLRFVLIILIFFIHNVLDYTESNGARISLEVPEYVRIIRYLISQILAASAVPLFTLISSYLLFSKNEPYKLVLQKKSKSILLPYVLWTIISILYFFCIQSISDKFYQSPLLNVRQFRLIDWIDIFCGLFTSRAPFPMVMQMWFLRDLFILIVFHKPIKKIIDKFPAASIITLTVLWVANFEHLNISHEVILFFCLGYYAVKFKVSIDIFDKLKWVDLLFVYIATATVELFFPSSVIFIHKVNIIMGVLFFLKLSKVLVANTKLYLKLEYLAGFSFFVYAAHEPTLNAVSNVWYRIFPMTNGYILFEYFGAILITVIFVLAVGILLKKKLPLIYNVLSGSR
jgi:hypothetical protein